MIPTTENHDDRLTDVDVYDHGSGPVVALAHGAGGSADANFGALAAFDPTRRYVGPNYPGSGATPVTSEPLQLETLADQVVASGVRAGAERFPIVGLSLGAAVAVTAAHRHPDRVSALVLTVGLAHADVQSRAFTTAWRSLAASGDLDGLAHLILLASFAGADLAALAPEVAAQAIGEVKRGYPPGGADQAELALRVDVRSLLPSIAVPTVVVVGGQDRIVLAETARELGRIDGAQVVEYPDAGHIFLPPADARWHRDIVAFLDAVSSPPAPTAQRAAAD